MKNAASLILLVIATSIALADEPNKNSPSTTENRPDKKVWDYFPNRTDLPKDGSFAKDPSFKPARILKRPAPKIDRGVPSGHFQLSLVFIVEADGEVREAVIAKSSGVQALDNAYLEMIRRWRYSAVEVKGKKIPTASLLPVELER